jgi:hypothetical protein
MVTVIECAGAPHVFTLTDGSVFRTLPYERSTILDGLVSEEMANAEKMGIISLKTVIPPPVPKAPEPEPVEEPVPEQAPVPVKKSLPRRIPAPSKEKEE